MQRRVQQVRQGDGEGAPARNEARTKQIQRDGRRAQQGRLEDQQCLRVGLQRVKRQQRVHADFGVALQ